MYNSVGVLYNLVGIDLTQTLQRASIAAISRICLTLESCVSLQPVDSTAEEKKKGKQEKAKKCIRTAAGTSWEDQSLLECDSGKIANDFRLH